MYDHLQPAVGDGETPAQVVANSKTMLNTSGCPSCRWLLNHCLCTRALHWLQLTPTWHDCNSCCVLQHVPTSSLNSSFRSLWDRPATALPDFMVASARSDFMICRWYTCHSRSASSTQLWGNSKLHQQASNTTASTFNSNLWACCSCSCSGQLCFGMPAMKCNVSAVLCPASTFSSMVPVVSRRYTYDSASADHPARCVPWPACPWPGSSLNHTAPTRTTMSAATVRIPGLAYVPFCRNTPAVLDEGKPAWEAGPCCCMPAGAGTCWDP